MSYVDDQARLLIDGGEGGPIDGIAEGALIGENLHEFDEMGQNDPLDLAEEVD